MDLLNLSNELFFNKKGILIQSSDFFKKKYPTLSNKKIKLQTLAKNLYEPYTHQNLNYNTGWAYFDQNKQIDLIFKWETFYFKGILSYFFNGDICFRLHFIDISSIYYKKLEFINKKEQLSIYTKSLINLAKNKSIFTGDTNKAFEIITKTISDNVGISRCSIWQYDKNAQHIKLLKLYEKFKKSYSEDFILYEKDYPSYFTELKKENIIKAPDVFNNKATIEFSTAYLIPLNIKSMLDIPIFIEGELFGIICCESQRKQIVWSEEDVIYIKGVCDIIANTLKAKERRKNARKLMHQKRLLEKTQNQIIDLNKNLEFRVQERTEELTLKNIQLKEYAFINSHVLRGPLSKIIGLLNLLDIENDDNEKQKILSYIKFSAQELDEVVSQINELVKG